MWPMRSIAPITSPAPKNRIWRSPNAPRPTTSASSSPPSKSSRSPVRNFPARPHQRFPEVGLESGGPATPRFSTAETAAEGRRCLADSACMPWRCANSRAGITRALLTTISSSPRNSSGSFAKSRSSNCPQCGRERAFARPVDRAAASGRSAQAEARSRSRIEARRICYHGRLGGAWSIIARKMMLFK